MKYIVESNIRYINVVESEPTTAGNGKLVRNCNAQIRAKTFFIEF